MFALEIEELLVVVAFGRDTLADSSPETERLSALYLLYPTSGSPLVHHGESGATLTQARLEAHAGVALPHVADVRGREMRRDDQSLVRD